MKIIYIVLSGILIFPCKVFAQELDHFLIGIYNYDRPSGFTAQHDPDPVANDFFYLKYIADQGFNYFIPVKEFTFNQPVSTNPDLGTFDRANQLGLKVINACQEMKVGQNDIPAVFNQSLAQSALNYFGSPNSLMGYVPSDEPRQIQSSVIASYCDEIKQYNSDFKVFVNLLPNWVPYGHIVDGQNIGWGGPAISTSDYNSYLDSYFSINSIDIIGNDSYPFYNKTSNRSFFQNLHLLAVKSVEYNKPFIYVSFTIHKNGQAKNIEEYRYGWYSAIAYTAKGISYFSRDVLELNNYWDRWDTHTSQFVQDELTLFHEKLTCHENVLLKLKYVNGYHYSTNSTVVSGEFEILPPNTDWTSFLNSSFKQNYFGNTNTPIEPLNGSTLDNIAVTINTDDNLNQYIWVLNKSLNNSFTGDFHFSNSLNLINFLDDEICLNTAFYEFTLLPGEAKLFQLGPSDISSICNTNINGNWYRIVSPTISIGAPNCGAVNFSNTSNSSFYGNKVLLDGGVHIPEGAIVALRPNEICDYQKSFKDNDEDLQYNEILIKPNPTRDIMEINSTKLISRVFVLNASGKVVYKLESINSNITRLNLSSISPGMYFLTITLQNGNSEVEKIIIQ